MGRPSPFPWGKAAKAVRIVGWTAHLAFRERQHKCRRGGGGGGASGRERVAVTGRGRGAPMATPQVNGIGPMLSEEGRYEGAGVPFPPGGRPAIGSPPPVRMPVLPATSTPDSRAFWGAADADVAQKKGRENPAMKVFRRGCLKGLILVQCSTCQRKCNVCGCDCINCNWNRFHDCAGCKGGAGRVRRTGRAVCDAAMCDGGVTGRR